MKLADLPSAVRPPADHSANRLWKRERRRATRREFLRLAAGAGVATGLAFVSFMPTARRAYATHETPSTYWQQPHTNRCYGPNSGHELASGTGCCRCGSDVSDDYCNSEDWHVHHVRNPDQWTRIHYRLRLKSCGRGTTNRRNAWIWRVGSTDWRCSDGEKKVCTKYSGGDWQCGDWQKTVCPAVV